MTNKADSFINRKNYLSELGPPGIGKLPDQWMWEALTSDITGKIAQQYLKGEITLYNYLKAERSIYSTDLIK